LLYKKGRVDIRKQGQAELGRLIGNLVHSNVLPLRLPESVQERLGHSHIDSLKGKALKANEDLLDALVCLYIAGLYTLIPHDKVYGSVLHGYVYVPSCRCVQ
jgi:predicted RNase H-like nuclease